MLVILRRRKAWLTLRSRPRSLEVARLSQVSSLRGGRCNRACDDLARRAKMTRVATTPRAAPRSRPASTSVSRPPGLLRRDGLLAALDRACLRKVTVISAPPGSGKTSLLRAWSEIGRAHV